MTMVLTTSTVTHVGNERDSNEDSVIVRNLSVIDATLLAVADGMGGHRAGGVASETALGAFIAAIKSRDQSECAIDTALTESVRVANEAVIDRARADGIEGMGTTMVAALVIDDRVEVVNVGDSRAYLVGDDIQQVTTDQTLVRELVDNGTISPEEAASHPHRHVLSQALGRDPEVTPDHYTEYLRDRTLLLCSDGLTEEVADPVIFRIVRRNQDPEIIGHRLVERANENGGSDNISVAVGIPADE